MTFFSGKRARAHVPGNLEQPCILVQEILYSDLVSFRVRPIEMLHISFAELLGSLNDILQVDTHRSSEKALASVLEIDLSQRSRKSRTNLSFALFADICRSVFGR